MSSNTENYAQMAIDTVASNTTPMMRQYQAIKEFHKEELLLFRLGDFYELFFEDAIVAARFLNIVLTKRGKHEDQDIPMCGIPVHAADFYMHKLLKQGHSIAICEQLESPEEAKKRGHKSIVRREVVRILTPGTVLEENLLNSHEANYITVITETRAGITLAWADLSTGGFWVENIKSTSLIGELSRIQPKEIIIADKTLINADISEQIRDSNAYLTRRPDSCFDLARCHTRICQFFGINSIEGLAKLNSDEIIACGALLEYVEHTHKNYMPLLQHIQQIRPEFFLQIDPATRASLELDRSLNGSRNNSLLDIMDHTATAAGARLMAAYLNSPLTELQAINERLDSVESFINTHALRQAIQKMLRHTPDIERILSRLSANKAKYPDLIKLVDGLQKWLYVAEMIHNSPVAPRIRSAASQVSSFDGLLNELFRALRIAENDSDQPAHSPRESLSNNQINTASPVEEVLLSSEAKLYIRPEYNPQLQRLYQIESSSQQKIEELRNKYRNLTGISSLKINKNNIIGWFVDVPPSQASKVNANNFTHRQSLANSARYTTQELSQLEMEILLCQDKIKMLENQIFAELCAKVIEQAEQISLSAKNIAEIDVFCSLAELAAQEGYVRPKLNNSQDFWIKNGKHPVIAYKMKDKFMANSCNMQTLAVSHNSGNTTLVNENRAKNGRPHAEEAGQMSLFAPISLSSVPEATDMHDIAKDKLTESPRNQENAGHKLWLLTGPNMAGKSTFLRQNALLCIMAQIGSFIPAEAAEIGVVDKIFSRIGASDRIAQGQSTFMVEMLETAYILRNATEKSFLIMDEIGRGTTTSDGLAIAWAIVENIVQKIKARTLFATHYHELTQLDTRLPISCYSMKVEEWNGKITFMHEVIPGKASNSYGIHVAAIAGMPSDLVQRAYSILGELRKK